MAELTSLIMPQIEARLNEFGMEILGNFQLSANDLVVLGDDMMSEKENERIGVMVAGSANMWQKFIATRQFDDGKPDPLNRWTGKVLDEIASEFGAKLKLPFERPFSPFQAWAMKAAQLTQSPLGILMHPRLGLWFGLCGVLFFQVNVKNQEVEKLIQQRQQTNDICQKCLRKPCLSACPVSAFGKNSLDVSDCFSHLDRVQNSQISPDCLQEGCGARSACPVGIENKYSNKQLRFHMRAYYKAD